jgi:hypothetical protein
MESSPCPQEDRRKRDRTMNRKNNCLDIAGVGYHLVKTIDLKTFRDDDQGIVPESQSISSYPPVIS